MAIPVLGQRTFVPEKVPMVDPQRGFRITKEYFELLLSLAGVYKVAPFTNADYTAITGAWTVTAAMVTTSTFRLVGTSLKMSFVLEGTTITGTPASLAITLPERSVAHRAAKTLIYLDDNGTPAVGVAEVAAGDTALTITRLDGSNFATSATNTEVSGQIDVEVR